MIEVAIEKPLRINIFKQRVDYYFESLGLFREPDKCSGLISIVSDYYYVYEKSECRVRIKFSIAEILGIFIKIKPKENSTIILNNAITAKSCRKEVLLVLCSHSHCNLSMKENY